MNRVIYFYATAITCVLFATCMELSVARTRLDHVNDLMLTCGKLMDTYEKRITFCEERTIGKLDHVIDMLKKGL